MFGGGRGSPPGPPPGPPPEAAWRRARRRMDRTASSLILSSACARSLTFRNRDNVVFYVYNTVNKMLILTINEYIFSEMIF